jgi:hypothetical protein
LGERWGKGRSKKEGLVIGAKERPKMGKSFTHDSGISPGLSVQLIMMI